MIVREDSINNDLVRLPEQPVGVDWPALSWERSSIDVSNPGLFDQQVDEVFDLSEAQGVTYGLLVVQRGKLVFERYAAGANAFYLQYSWSMAKSITHALVGILAGKGQLDIYAPAPVAEWRDDERAVITLDQLLRMASGLRFIEDYVDGEVSDVIPMLNTTGRHDTGAFAAAMPQVHEPGTFWSYSSGTTNIICRVLRDIIGNGATGMLDFMRDELFEPLGMRSPTPKFDVCGDVYRLFIPVGNARRFCAIWLSVSA